MEYMIRQGAYGIYESVPVPDSEEEGVAPAALEAVTEEFSVDPFPDELFPSATPTKKRGRKQVKA